MPQNRIKSGDINPLINPLNFQQILKAALELNQQLEEVLREKSRASQEAEAKAVEALRQISRGRKPPGETWGTLRDLMGIL
jgi:response regulator of citrate/malate metabolism